MYLKRNSEAFLEAWKEKKNRKPLILRGARQTGKSRLIEEFGKRFYENMVVVNLEKEPHLKQFFNLSETAQIIRELEIIKNISIVPEKTLIFIDEIQEYPPAIAKLRYLYEDLPQYHVIAAGSLLEFVLEKEQLSFPVGRVEFHYLFPLTFDEFLCGNKKNNLYKFLADTSLKNAISPAVHEELRKSLVTYLIVGGMPEAIVQFLESNKYLEAEAVKESILETYRYDFKKYSRRANVGNLQMFFSEAPKWIGRRVNLSKMNEGLKSRDAGVALDLLQRAMVVYRVNRLQSLSYPMLPLKKAQPKLVFLDLGLVQYANHISEEILRSENYHSIYKGAFAEQLVAQELLALLGSCRYPELFYWQRENKGATAEIDYIFPYKAYLLPIEVKAGKGPTLFSLHQFMAQYNVPLAIRIYDGQLLAEEIYNPVTKSNYKMLSVPLYLIAKLPEFVKEILNE